MGRAKSRIRAGALVLAAALAAPAPAPAISKRKARRVLKGLGRLVGGVLTGTLAGRARAEARRRGAPRRPITALPAHEGLPASDAPGATFFVRGGLDFLVLAMPDGTHRRVPVPSSSTRRVSRLSLNLPPGNYAWVGFLESRTFTHSMTVGRRTVQFPTLCVWDERSAFRFPFSVVADGPRYGGTLDLEVVALRGGGPSNMAQPAEIWLPEGSAVVRAEHWGDHALFVREWAAAGRDPAAARPSPAAAAAWRDRGAESGAFPRFEEFAKYTRWLGRLSRATPSQVMAGWPRLSPVGGEGVAFRLALHEVWTRHVAAEHAAGRRRVDLGAWSAGAAVRAAATFEAEAKRRELIRKIFDRGRAREAAAEARRVEAAAADSWGRRVDAPAPGQEVSP